MVASGAAELGIANVGGVFVVLLFGCMFALIVAICEFMWNVNKLAVEEKITPFDALKEELSFALNISISTKPVHNKSSEEGSPERSLKSQSPAVSHIGSEQEPETRSIMENSQTNGNNNNGATLSTFSKIGNLFRRKFNQ